MPTASRRRPQTGCGGNSAFRRAGRLATFGATTGLDAKADLRFLFSRQLSLLGSFMGTMGELHRVLSFVFRGQSRR